MDEYVTVMIKENDMSNLKLLTEKLNEGFRIDDRIEVGKSTVVTLRKRSWERNERQAVPSLTIDGASQMTTSGSY